MRINSVAKDAREFLAEHPGLNRYIEGELINNLASEVEELEDFIRRETTGHFVQSARQYLTEHPSLIRYREGELIRDLADEVERLQRLTARISPLYSTESPNKNCIKRWIHYLAG